LSVLQQKIIDHVLINRTNFLSKFSTLDVGKKRVENERRSNAFSSPHIYDQTPIVEDEMEEHIGKQWNTDGGNEWELTHTNAKLRRKCGGKNLI
jgi:hypothetical protein